MAQQTQTRLGCSTRGADSGDRSPRGVGLSFICGFLVLQSKPSRFSPSPTRVTSDPGCRQVRWSGLRKMKFYQRTSEPGSAVLILFRSDDDSFNDLLQNHWNFNPLCLLAD